MMMTACDLSGITKPWKTQRGVSKTEKGTWEDFEYAHVILSIPTALLVSYCKNLKVRDSNLPCNISELEASSLLASDSKPDPLQLSRLTSYTNR